MNDAIRDNNKVLLENQLAAAKAEIERQNKCIDDWYDENQRLRAALEKIRDYVHLGDCGEHRYDYCECPIIRAQSALDGGKA